jgi:regulator of protease activity HflC (stomatin/prohibitin superfamily)
VKQALGQLKILNDALARYFKHGAQQREDASDFEKRFGVIIGDVTVSELLPSKEVQKAMDGASESAALDEIVMRNLGYPSIEAVHEAVKAGKLTSDQVREATENAMAMTDNLHGLDLKRQTFTLRLQGDTDLIDAARAIATSPAGPAILGALTKGANQSPKGR